ncbi:hypothetical protein E2320_005680 [Naja naja]|nr:hypothetical protein E2320_005680 [Naja naja]
MCGGEAGRRARMHSWEDVRVLELHQGLPAGAAAGLLLPRHQLHASQCPVAPGTADALPLPSLLPPPDLLTEEPRPGLRPIRRLEGGRLLTQAVLTTFYNLRNLNLHGNSIQQLSEVDKLAVLPHLRNLTLHGNPIEEEKGYRSYILSTLPQLKNFDFSGVTKLDRSTAAVWRRMNIKPKVIRKKRERY